ncbi:DUF4381 domain-containing protein [Shewanella maritima]|uniref:DUF4381 domain-containing protein n=1 Tax=Shewanella maritima TaxID=2520507 RepID=UPI0037357319
MMSAPSPLDQMHDIVLPPQVHQLPIAPGYWVMLILVLATLLWLFSRWRKAKQYHQPRKQALLLLEQLPNNSQNLAIDINSLFKRTAMSYLPRAQIAHLDGDAWTQWLELRLPKQEQGKLAPLLALRYSATPLTEPQQQQLTHLARLWLNSTIRFDAPHKEVA